MATSVEVPKEINIDQQAESYNEANTLSPMAQYGEAPMALWQSVPIAPPLPSADSIAPPDFTENFVQNCLYPSKTFLVAEGLEPEKDEATDESPKKEEDTEKKVSKLRTPKGPREPQPDYFGHLFGHPLSADEEDDEEEDPCEGETKELGTDGTIDEKADDVDEKADDVDEKADDVDEKADDVDEKANEVVELTNEVDEKSRDFEATKGESDTVLKDSEKPPATAVEQSSERVPEENSRAEVELTREASEPEASDDGDDDVDYFGHIMGHPMNRGTGSRKAKKQESPTRREPSPQKSTPKAEAESQESQGSVLGLFLGGVEVCDREENIGQFTSRGDEPVDSADVQPEVREDVRSAEPEKSREVEEKAVSPEKLPSSSTGANDSSKAKADPVEAAPEETAPTANEQVPASSAPDTPGVEKTQEAPVEKIPEKIVVETKPAEDKQVAEKRNNEAVGSSSTAKKPAKKSRSFLGNLCGSKTMD
ncbi:hypothetical protein FOZ61_002505 [Perkinsus olseni]|uniref:Uncharacterized protein n=1 Tax=Perkinsus olseni TaxID=32597 RepID=A0A7J6MEG5_PEROL|nr:hypothetical protein FOZ61_002505 [Perkinsus olseni]KAF4675540.1 hypothetical protein FOL46_001069 [Perkinsus olseni]